MSHAGIDERNGQPRSAKADGDAAAVANGSAPIPIPTTIPIPIAIAASRRVGAFEAGSGPRSNGAVRLDVDSDPESDSDSESESQPRGAAAREGDPDAALVARCLRGDPAARERLFHRHWAVARRVAARLLGHEQDAEDAAQTGLVKAFARLDDFDGRCRFQTWLLRIVTNTALDEGRRRGRRPLGLAAPGGLEGVEDRGRGRELHGVSRVPNPDDNLRRQDLRRVLDRALAKLSPNLRATFVLFAEAGLTYQEVADSLEIPIGTVMSRIHEARRKLQNELRDRIGDDLA